MLSCGIVDSDYGLEEFHAGIFERDVRLGGFLTQPVMEGFGCALGVRVSMELHAGFHERLLQDAAV